jgi:hypothetical protein
MAGNGGRYRLAVLFLSLSLTDACLHMVGTNYYTPFWWGLTEPQKSRVRIDKHEVIILDQALESYPSQLLANSGVHKPGRLGPTLIRPA